MSKKVNRSYGRHTYGEVAEVVAGSSKATIEVGNFCSFGADVVAFLGANHFLDRVTTFPFPKRGWDGEKLEAGYIATCGSKVLKVGHDVWVGRGARLFGVEIGSGAVIGAAAMVPRDVPPYAVVAGNPARIIRYRFSPETIERLLKVAWWNWTDVEIQGALPWLCSNQVDQFLGRYLSAERTKGRGK